MGCAPRLPGSQAFLPRVAGAFALHSVGASSAHRPVSLPAPASPQLRGGPVVARGPRGEIR